MVIESIILGMLHDQDLFNYEDPVCKHWPEFARNGKENVTISDVLRHSSGLVCFQDKHLSPLSGAMTGNLKSNHIGQIIEAQRLQFPQFGKSELHSVTRGLILNELVRRIDLKVNLI